MQIAVLGAGAMGSLYGGYLSAANEVVLVDICKEHISAVNRDGLVVEGVDGSTRTFRPGATTNCADVGAVDLLIVFVKSMQTLGALEENRPLIGENTLLLSLQNGYGNADDMLNFAPKDRILVGTTSHGCRMKKAGRVHHTGRGATYLGALAQDQTNAGMVADLLTRAGFETEVSGNVEQLLWSKLFVNVGINPITALLAQPNIRIAENPHANQAARRAVYEAVSVANADGMNFDPATVFENVCQVAVKTGNNHSSMFADIANKRPTEILKINGAVVKKAEQLGIAAPYNTMLTDLILALEDDYHTQQKENSQ